jgi:tetratricopeptide (TPR) repeat protein
MIPNETLEQYQKLLESDPKSKAFAPLADGYRQRGLLQEAFKLCEVGLKHNPSYASGHLAMGRILKTQGQLHEALKYFMTAVTLSPENLLAYQLLGDTFLDLKQAKEALQAYKIALFIDPKLDKAQKAVKRLETLSSSEYEQDLFEMKNITLPQKDEHRTPLKERSFESSSQSIVPLNLERELSFIDTLLVRGDVQKAQDRLEQVLPLFPGNTDLLHRYGLLKPEEIPTPLRPEISREKRALENKRKALERLEKAIEQRHALIANHHLTSS